MPVATFGQFTPRESPLQAMLMMIMKRIVDRILSHINALPFTTKMTSRHLYRFALTVMLAVTECMDDHHFGWVFLEKSGRICDVREIKNIYIFKIYPENILNAYEYNTIISFFVLESMKSLCLMLALICTSLSICITIYIYFIYFNIYTTHTHISIYIDIQCKAYAFEIHNG